MLKRRDKEDFTEEHQAHPQRKEEASSAKTADKAHSSTDNNFMSATFDKQCSSDPLRRCTTVVSCAFTTYVRSISPHQMMRHVIAGQKLKESVEAMRLQLAFLIGMIGFVSSPVWFLTCPYFLILAVAEIANQNVAAMFLYAVQRTPLQVNAQGFIEWSLSHGM